MQKFIIVFLISVLTIILAPQKARAYDVDCAIILCMAGGFPPNAVCARAYRTMIRRITPWPVQPPFGICSFAAVPIALGGPGGVGAIDTNLPEYAWLNRTRVIWFQGSSNKDDDGSRDWNWSIRSCTSSNETCSFLARRYSSNSTWPESFVTQNGQTVALPLPRSFIRAVMVEFGDYEGNVDHSDWYVY